MKYTPWFPPTEKPVRPGVYQIKATAEAWFRRWDGHTWHYGADTSARAALRNAPFPEWANEPWRGILKEEA